MHRWLAAALVAALLAGCTDDGGPAADALDDVQGKAARDVRTQLRSNDTLEAPVWALGDRWVFQVTQNAGFGEAVYLVNAIVSGRTGNSWELRTDDAETALWHSAFDFNILGNFADGTLTTNYYGEVFTWYQFPLEHGASWQGNVARLQDPYSQWIDSIFDDTPPQSYALTYTASYVKDIETPLGTRPGFLIEARDADQQLRLRYDYVPAVGWFTKYEEFQFGGDFPTKTIRLQQYSRNQTATVFTAEASPALHYLHVVAFNPGIDPGNPGPPQDPGPIFTNNLPQADFRVEGDTLFGFLFAGTLMGHAETRLFDAANQERAEASATGLPPEFFGFDAPEVFIPADPDGTWRFMTAGGGAGYGGGAWIWNGEVTSADVAP